MESPHNSFCHGDLKNGLDVQSHRKKRLDCLIEKVQPHFKKCSSVKRENVMEVHFICAEMYDLTCFCSTENQTPFDMKNVSQKIRQGVISYLFASVIHCKAAFFQSWLYCKLNVLTLWVIVSFTVSVWIFLCNGREHHIKQILSADFLETKGDRFDPVLHINIKYLHI